MSLPATLQRFRQTLGMRLFGWLKIPLLASVRPSVVELSETRCVVRIPLRRRTRNHLGSMYFGALAIGADCAGGLLAMDQIKRSGGAVSLVFRSFQATFLKRPESDVYFVCEQGEAIRDQVRRTLASEERITEPMAIQAVVKLPDGSLEPVAEFTLELSLKRKG
jgi:acyl-coenzyme A thioesterase PaaI-like protein